MVHRAFRKKARKHPRSDEMLASVQRWGSEDDVSGAKEAGGGRDAGQASRGGREFPDGLGEPDGGKDES